MPAKIDPDIPGEIRDMEHRISDIPATSFVTLSCHAIESRSKHPILHDPKAEEITSELIRTLSRSGDSLDRMLASGRIDRNLVTHIAIRAKKYDEYAREFLAGHPGGVIVNIGCGLDSRFLRIDEGSVIFYDLDLPEIIDLKRRFFRETDRYHFIASSVLDFRWMHTLSGLEGPFLFMAEGVFMYLEGDDVRSLVLQLRETFPGSELVCEVVNSFWLKKPLKALIDWKIHHRGHLGRGAVFRSGLRDGREMEQWHPDIRFLGEWSYFDSDEEKLGWLRLFRHIGWIRKTQWTVRYLLG